MDIIKQMSKMTEALQPSCDEKLVAAMTCSLSGSMSALLTSKLLGGVGTIVPSVGLPNPVFIAVGEKTIYAFDYAPRGFKFKIKDEVARWSRDEVKVVSENTGSMANFIISTRSGENYALEVPTMMGGRELVAMFLEALGGG